MVDLLKEKTVVSPFTEEPPMSSLLSEENQQMNCNPESVVDALLSFDDQDRENRCHSRVMRCSLNAIPQTKDLLQKSRLPLGILIHPFKDLEVRTNTARSFGSTVWPFFRV